MGWSRGHAAGREVGYGVAAVCDWPGCKQIINRGLGWACGGTHGEDEFSCAGYFCSDHRNGYREGAHGSICNECVKPPSKRRRGAGVFAPNNADAIQKIFDDLCELPGYTSPPDQPDLLQCTTDELHIILARHLLGRE